MSRIICGLPLALLEDRARAPATSRRESSRAAPQRRCARTQAASSTAATVFWARIRVHRLRGGDPEEREERRGIMRAERPLRVAPGEEVLREQRPGDQEPARAEERQQEERQEHRREQIAVRERDVERFEERACGSVKNFAMMSPPDVPRWP